MNIIGTLGGACAAALLTLAPAQAQTKLVAWWDFEKIESDGVTVKSVLGGYSGRITGLAVVSGDGDGRPGGGRGFMVSPSDHLGQLVIEAPGDDHPLNVAAANDNITITLWQKNNGTPNATTFYAVADDTDRSTQAHIPWSDGAIYWDSGGCCGGDTRISRLPSGHDFSAWHLYSFVKRGGTKEIWIDGNLLITQDGYKAHSILNTELFLGSDPNAAWNLDGTVDDFVIWKGALSPQQIDKLASGAKPSDLVIDTDKDGTPDDWETQYGFNPNDPADAKSDFDQDGFDNVAEYIAGTDPKDMTPPTLVGASTDVSGTKLLLTFSEKVDPLTAGTVGNYSVTPALAVTAAEVKGRTVTLTTTRQTFDGTEYVVSVSNVKDLSKKTIVPGSKISAYAFVTLRSGVARISIWTGVGGNSVQALLDDPRYPAAPDWSAALFSLNSRDVLSTDRLEYYGATIDAIISPEESGDYRFFISTDNASQLFLSTDDKEANLVQIAEEIDYGNPFTEPDSPRTSKPIALTAGAKYFIRLIYKEGVFADYAKVSWRKEGDATPAGSLRPIDGKFLSAEAVASPVGFIKSVSPTPKTVQAGNNIEIVHVDGRTVQTAATTSLEVDGAKVNATIEKSGIFLTVKYTAGFKPNTKHTAKLNYLDVAGKPTSYSWEFSTNPLNDPNALFIEAEDFNFDGGQTITDQKIGMNGKYPGGAYQDRGGVPGIDFHNPGGNAGQPYRPETGVAAGKGPNGGGRNRGLFDVDVNYTVGWLDPGDWQNYTRTFPTVSQKYFVFGYVASGGAPIQLELGYIYHGLGTENQSVLPLAELKPGRATAGWDSLELMQFTDPVTKAPAVLELQGTVPLRLTVPGGNVDVDFLSFVPAPPEAVATVSIRDSDQDGIPDLWEVAYGFNQQDPSDAAFDFDADGHNNLAEFKAGTDPRDMVPPTILEAEKDFSGSKIILTFSELLDPVTAGAVENYSISPASIVTAAEPRGKTVTLTFAGQLSSITEYVVSVSNVQDLSRKSIMPTSRVSVSNGMFKQRSYDLVENLMTWDQAKADAEARGGHLVTITSQEEWDAIKNQLINRLRGKITWIGATDRSQPNQWEWVTGESFSFTRWHPNEPNGSGNVAVIGWDSPEELLWDDYGDGSSLLPYLIEWEINPTNTTQRLVGQWTFEPGEELIDRTRNFPPLLLRGNASIRNGSLIVSGVGATADGWAVTDSSAGSYSGPHLTNKTLMAWVTLTGTANIARAGSAITIDRISSDSFDGIVFSELEVDRWMNGSTVYQRSQNFDAGINEVLDGKMIHLAITYKMLDGGGMRITGYRNGVVLGVFETQNASNWSTGDAEVFFGVRHGSITGGPGGLNAVVHEARIYNSALSFDEINSIKGEVTASPAGFIMSVSPIPNTVQAGNRIEIVHVDGRTVQMPNTTKLEVDGVTVNATIEKSGNLLTVSYMADFKPNTKHSAKLHYLDIAGNPTSYGWEFSTNPLNDPNAIFIEAEDFDFDGGQTITGQNIGMTGRYPGGAYQDRGGIPGIDFSNMGGNAGQPYRIGTGVAAGKGPNGGSRNRGLFDVDVNYTVGWNDIGDWQNYTRTFPAVSQKYFVFGYVSSGGAPIQLELGHVYQGSKTENQSVLPLAELKPGRATAGWDSLELIQFTDPVTKAPAVLELQGTVPLRLTVPGGNVDVDFLSFVPAPSDSLATVSLIRDRDQDGIPDYWEVAYGFNPNDPADGKSDFDQDGFDNVAEYKAGTDPKDLTPPTLVGVSGSASGTTLTLTFSERVDPVTAGTLANYSFSPALSVTAAAVKGNTVTLTTAKQNLGTTYAVTVNNVQDLSKKTIAAGSEVYYSVTLTTVSAITGGDPGEGLDLQGNFTYALNIGTAGTAGKVGDANFEADHAPGVSVEAQNEIGSWGTMDLGTSDNDKRLGFVLNSIRWSGAPNVVTLKLKVEKGVEYKLQLLFAEWCCPGRGFNVIINGQTEVTNFRPGFIQAGDGDFIQRRAANAVAVTHQFTAQSDTLTIVLDGPAANDPAINDRNAIVNGLTLERISLLSDTDNDGTPDYWEIQYGFNLNDPADGKSDFDQDGFDNVVEYNAGTDPKDITPPTLVGASGSASGTTLTLTFSERVDPVTAGTLANYSVSPALSVTAAAVNGNTVTLTTAKQNLGTEYTVTVNNVQDLSKKTIAAGSKVGFPSPLRSLIKNGGFETGDFSGWTQVGDTGSCYVEDGNGWNPRRNPASGNYLSAFGNEGPGGIEQQIDTEPGSFYTVEFAFFNGAWTTNDFYFQATWDGQVVLDFKKPEPAAVWRYYRYTVQATGAQSKVGFVTKPAGYFNLDSIVAYKSGQNSSRYELVENLVTWDQAKVDAEARGGHLVTITSQEEWDAIKGQLMDRLRGKIIWIGANDRSQPNQWEWVTGEPFTFSPWHPNEPNGSGSVAVMGWDSPEELLWDDYGDGSSLLPYLIEWEGTFTNTPPRFAGATNAVIDELVGYTQHLKPLDNDVPAQPLVVTLVSGPTGMVVTNSVLAWTPSEAQGPSTNSVVVAVSDGKVTVTSNFTVIVREVVEPPSNAVVLGLRDLKVSMGGEVRVPVVVENFNRIDTLQFTLAWDPTVVAYKGVQGFGLPGMTEANFGVLKDGQGRTNRVAFSWDDSNFVGVTRTNGSVILELVLQAVGATGTTGALTFVAEPAPASATVDTTAVPLRTVNGSVTVQSRLSGLVEYYVSTAGRVPGVRVTLGGEGTGSVTTGSDGTYSVEAPGGAFTMTPTLETDAPLANGVTTADIAILRRHILGITPLDSAYKVLAGDVNASSSVTTADITLIRRLILGVSTNFASGLWRFVPSDEVFTNTLVPWSARRSRSYASMPSVTTGHDFKAIKMGDVNGSWKVPTTTGASAVRAKSRPKATLEVGAGREVGDGVRVHEVRLKGVRVLTSMQFTLAWDPAEAVYEGVEAGALKDLGLEHVGTGRSGQGLVAVSWDPANGVGRHLGGEAVVLGLRLRSKPGRTLSRLTVPESPTVLEVTEASVPVGVGVVGWEAGLTGAGSAVDAVGGMDGEARLRVLGPDEEGQVVLEVVAGEGQAVGVEWSSDLRLWTTVWEGMGQGSGSPVRIEPRGQALTAARFWRVRVLSR